MPHLVMSLNIATMVLPQILPQVKGCVPTSVAPMGQEPYGLCRPHCSLSCLPLPTCCLLSSPTRTALPCSSVISVLPLQTVLPGPCCKEGARKGIGLGCMWTMCVPVYAQMCLGMCDYECPGHSTLTHTSIPAFVLTCRKGHVTPLIQQGRGAKICGASRAYGLFPAHAARLRAQM